MHSCCRWHSNHDAPLTDPEVIAQFVEICDGFCLAGGHDDPVIGEKNHVTSTVYL